MVLLFGRSFAANLLFAARRETIVRVNVRTSDTFVLVSH